MAGELLIKRLPHTVDALGPYRIYVGDALIGRLGPDDELVIGLPNGDHDVVAWVGWCRSNVVRIPIHENQVTALEVGAGERGSKLSQKLYHLTVGRTDYLFLRERAHRHSARHSVASATEASNDAGSGKLAEDIVGSCEHT